MTFDGTITTSSVALFALYQGITSLGLPMMDVSCVMSLMLQFPLERGYVVLIMKTFNGLGTAVLMAYFNGWFKAADADRAENNNYSGYAYFVGGQILLCSLIGACFTRLPTYFPCSWTKKRLSSEEAAEREKTLDLYMSQHAPTRRLRIGFAIVVATLIFSTTQSITTAYVNTSRAGYLAISIVAVLLMASFSVIAMPFQFLGRYTPVCPTHMEGIGKATTGLEHERKGETTSELLWLTATTLARMGWPFQRRSTVVPSGPICSPLIVGVVARLLRHVGYRPGDADERCSDLSQQEQRQV
ncbi:hypothetical protein C4B63_10g312 [Trypanosoma cruzi]|uniref:Nodulin-like domain-containing protein n=1 Tax=Trypanosoma cruzi TaxID=5693 RepID=A0A2V2VV74_TRYCR|nr:hypothetical protein C4B63_10g312 [Trypanosoma cruzi]